MGSRGRPRGEFSARSAPTGTLGRRIGLFPSLLVGHTASPHMYQRYQFSAHLAPHWHCLCRVMKEPIPVGTVLQLAPPWSPDRELALPLPPHECPAPLAVVDRLDCIDGIFRMVFLCVKEECIPVGRTLRWSPGRGSAIDFDQRREFSVHPAFDWYGGPQRSTTCCPSGPEERAITLAQLVPPRWLY